jgi:G3E family GTPase
MAQPTVTTDQDILHEQPLPVSVLTGFLGSGKTTVLRHLLQQPETNRVAVVINEFGEIGLDHLLVASVDDSTVLLNNGCLCCSVRDDLIRTLRGFYVRRAAGEILTFDRVVIETTGLGDPISIIHSLIRDPLLADCYRLDGVITTVDALTGEATLDRHPEAIKQAAVADRLLLTKVDLAAASTQTTLSRRLRAINAAAPIMPTTQGKVSPKLLFNAGYYDPETKSADVRRWLAAETYAEEHAGHGHDHDDGHDHADHAPSDPNRHDDHIRSFCLVYDRPLPWRSFTKAIQSLIDAHGADMLRIKGVLNIQGRNTPTVIHGVQHVFHPPVLLDAWPDGDRRSRLVFITRDVAKESVVRSLSFLDDEAASRSDADRG